MNDLQVTGQKKEQKLYRKHSGYTGNLKETVFKDMMQKKPTEVGLNYLTPLLCGSMISLAPYANSCTRTLPLLAFLLVETHMCARSRAASLESRRCD